MIYRYVVHLLDAVISESDYQYKTETDAKEAGEKERERLSKLASDDFGTFAGESYYVTTDGIETVIVNPADL